MRIAYIGAGAAHMYCGSCLHANALVTALLAKGEDITLVPLYTPLRTDEPDVSLDRVFLSGINIYLQHRWPILRHMPMALHTLLENRRLLEWATSRASVTDSTGLGPLTLSVLQGEAGPQATDVEELTDFLAQHVRPDIVQLPNSMMIALAGPIRRRLGVPVLCSLQGEDLFISGLREPYQRQVRETISRRAEDVDGFVATSVYGADWMAEFLNLDRDRIHVVQLGLSLDGYDVPRPAASGPPSVGYMARICPEKGFGLAVDAFLELSGRQGPGSVRLVAAGYLDRHDRAFLTEMRLRIADAGLEPYFDYRGEVTREGKIELLRSVDILSVPSPYREPKGLYVLESLAAGTPVVQPRHGAFVKLIEHTGGGLLVEPDSAPAFADGWQQLLTDTDQRQAMGEWGREVVRRDFSDSAMAEATLELYRGFV